MPGKISFKVGCDERSIVVGSVGVSKATHLTMIRKVREAWAGKKLLPSRAHL